MSDILADPIAQRVVNMLATAGVRRADRARLFRALAEFEEPPGMRACEECGELFKRRRGKRHCRPACRQAAWRKRLKP